MTLALAIGHEWLYDRLSPASRETIRAAIVEKGLKASLDGKGARFLGVKNNWNQVCNGGMLYGALSVYESDKELALDIINRSIRSIRQAMEQYAPDGTYPEGIGYWTYSNISTCCSSPP